MTSGHCRQQHKTMGGGPAGSDFIMETVPRDQAARPARAERTMASEARTFSSLTYRKTPTPGAGPSAPIPNVHGLPPVPLSSRSPHCGKRPGYQAVSPG
jgi:hypothetical protein